MEKSILYVIQNNQKHRINENGNLVKDSDAKISSIQYNLLNLQRMTKSFNYYPYGGLMGERLLYGIKIRMEHINHSSLVV